MNLHTSHYTIAVKLQNEENKHLLVHGYTGAIDIVDSSIVNAMNADDVTTTLSSEEISLLSQRGYLTEKTRDEEHSYVIRFADLLHKANSKLFKTFGFVITYNCNFRCPYCFENIISKNGEAWTKQTLTKELVDKAYEAMLKIEPHRELHGKEILLYGGEPLLRENHDIVSYIIAKGHKLGYTFRAITNGYDLDYYIDLLSQNYISRLQISIDGFKDNHNKNKSHFIEGNSFEKVMSNIGLALKNNVSVNVRINLGAENIADLNILKQYFSDEGFLNYSNFSMYAAKIEQKSSENKNNKVEYLNNRQFNEAITKSTSAIEDIKKTQIVEMFKRYFSTRKKIHFTSVGCSGQFGTYMFGPEGGIYTCFETVGKKEHCIGYYNDSELQWTPAKQMWFSKHVGNSEQCNKCRYALLCGGSCAIKDFTNPCTKICSRFKDLFNEAVNKAYNETKC